MSEYDPMAEAQRLLNEAAPEAVQTLMKLARQGNVSDRQKRSAVRSLRQARDQGRLDGLLSNDLRRELDEFLGEQ
jgi:hypothetical protein